MIKNYLNLNKSYKSWVGVVVVNNLSKTFTVFFFFNFERGLAELKEFQQLHFLSFLRMVFHNLTELLNLSAKY